MALILTKSDLYTRKRRIKMALAVIIAIVLIGGVMIGVMIAGGDDR